MSGFDWLRPWRRKRSREDRRPDDDRSKGRGWSFRKLRVESLEERHLLSAVAFVNGPEFQVNTYTTGSQTNTRNAMDAAGDFVEVWESDTGDGSLAGIFAQRYSAAGVPQGSQFQVNTNTAGNQFLPRVAMDAAGDFVVTWQSNGNGYDIFAQRYNAVGVAQGSEFKINTYTTSDQRGAFVAMDAAGNFVVAWNSSGQDGSGSGVYAQRYNAAGTPQGAEFRVNTYTTDDQGSVKVGMDSTGDFVVTWGSVGQDGNGYGVYAQRYNSAGVTQGTEFRVNTYTTNDQTKPAVALDSAGDFVVIWLSDGQDGSKFGVYAQRYNASGVAQGGEFRVNTYTTGNQGNTSIGSGPSVAMDAAGDFTVSWHSPAQDGNGYGVFAQRYNLAGVAQGAEFQVNSYTTASQSDSSVSMDASGDTIVSWASNGQDGSQYGIYAQRYLVPGAMTAGSEFRVNTYTTGSQRFPELGVDSAGDYVVVWQSVGQDGSNAGVYAQRYNSAGAAQGSEFRVNTYTAGAQANPAVAMDSAGDFVVVWQSYAQDGSGYGVYAQRFNSAGVAQGSEFRVNTYTTSDQRSPRVAMDSAGDFVVTWYSNTQDGSNNGVYAQRYNSSGVAQGAEFLVNTYTTGDQFSPSVAMDASGDFVMSWVSAQDGSGVGIYAQRYNSAGAVQGGEFRVNTYTSNNQNLPSVGMDSAGDFVIAWASYPQDGSNYGVYAQRYNAAGVAQGSEFRVNTYTTNYQIYPYVAVASSGDFVIAWQSFGQDGSNEGVYAERYNSAGAAQGSEFRVNTYTASVQADAAVALDTAGNFIIAWGSVEDGDGSAGIYAQRYLVHGSTTQVSAVGSEFRVNTYTTGLQDIAAVATDAAGDFVVVWESYGQDGSDFGIYAQRYSASGTAVGNEFRVNTYTTARQAGPAVAMDSAGDFVVAWAGDGPGGNVYDIYAQRYASSGAPAGSQFRVNTYTTSEQNVPTVAMDSAGDFVIAWHSLGQDGSMYGIYAQRFDTSGVAQGSEFRVNTYTTNEQIYPALAMDSGGDFVVAWNASGEDGSLSGIYAQRYNASGVVQGSEFLVNTYTANNQSRPAVGMDSVGDLVVEWQSKNQDGSGYGIYAQRYTSSGAAVGGEFRVNTYTTLDQNSCSTAMDSAGDFVGVWESATQDGIGGGIYAQYYSSSGVASRGEFRVNTYTSVSQRFPAIAMDSLGNFIVAWESLTQDGSGYGIYAQRYSSVTPPVVTTSSGTLSYTSNSGAQAIDPNLSLSDGESTVITSATVVVSSGYNIGEDVLEFTNQNNITGSFTSGTLTLTGIDTVANYQAVLESVTYTNTAGNAHTAARTISYTVNDGISASNTATKTVSPQTSATATQSVVTSQPPSSVTAGASFTLTVAAEDASNNTITSYSGTVALVILNNPGSSTLGGTTTVTVTNGIAAFSGLTLNKVGSGYTLSATSGTLTSVTTNSITVSAGAATQLVVTTQPPSTVTAGASFGVTVAAEDSFGNTATSYSGSIALAIANNPGSSTLGGTTSVSVTSGIASFSGLTLNKVGSGYTLQATSGTLTSAVTNSIAVSPGAATQLLITTQPPSNVTAGASFGLTVAAEDAQGNTATGYSGTVALAILNNPGSSTLGGTTTVTVTNGIASFSGLTLNKVGSGYTLSATSGTLTSAVTNSIRVSPGAATQLLITTQPPSSVTAGASFALTVAAEDAQGNTATGYSGTVALAILNNPGSSTLGGTTSVSVTSGMASFSGLTLDHSGSGYTLSATSDTLTSATTSSITVAAGAATQLIVTTQPPSSVTAGSGFSLTVTAEDAQGNTASSYAGSVSLAISNNPGGSTLGGTATVSATSGVASFSGLTLNKVGSGYTLQATSGTLTSVTTNSITVSAGTATQLVIATQPPNTVTAGASFGLTVAAEDQFGNTVTGYGGGVSVALLSNPGNSTLGGTTSVSVTSGLATFSTFTLNKVGSGYTLQATSGTLTSATTSAITVTPGAATQLLITTQPPSTVTAGASFGLTVAAEDQFGNTVTGYSGSVTVALLSNPGSSTLGGTTSVSATSGLASFTGLSLDKVGTGYTLQASSGTLTSVTTSAITVTPGVATQLLITTQPPSTVTAGSSFGFTVTAEDQFGNMATGYSGSVAVALLNNPGSSTLGGTTNVSVTSGVATFSGLTLNKVGSGYTLQASSGTLSSATTSDITVTPATATQMVVTTQPPSTVTAGSSFSLTLAAEDALGNVAFGFSGSVTIGLVSNPGSSTLGGTTSVSATSGIAIFSGLTLDKAGSGYTLQATSSTLSAATTNSITVVAGAATQLVITTEPPSTVTAGSSFGFTVAAEDPFGNTATDYSDSVSVALLNNPGGSTLGGTTSTSATSGVASFAGLSLDKVGSGYTLQVTSGGVGVIIIGGGGFGSFATFSPTDDGQGFTSQTNNSQNTNSQTTGGTLTAATTSGITVIAGSATQLVVTTQPPSTITAGTGFGLTITAEDQFGNTASSYTGSVSVALLNNPGGSTLGGTTSVSVTSGVAAYSGLTLDKAASGYTLEATSSTLSAADTASITVMPGTATQLLITSQPPSTVTAGASFGLTVTAEDQFGNTATSYSGSVAVALLNNPGSSTLGGTTSISATSGIVSFSALTLNKVGAGYTLRATSGTLTSATTTAVTVTPGTTTQLLITTQPPSTVTAGAGFGLTVTAEDQFGNTATGYTGSVAVALLNNPGGSTLGGTTSASATSGVASFSGLSLNKVGAGYTLRAASGTLTSATTSNISVAPGTATQLLITTQPPSTVTAGAGFGLTVTAEDQFGNTATGYSGSVAVALLNNPGSSTLGGTTNVSATSGVVSFSGLTLNKVGAGYTLQATSGTLSSATSGSITVTPGATTQLVVTTQPPATVTAGGAFGFTITAEDQFGNTASAYGGSVAVALLNNPGGSTLGGTTSISATSGVARFSALTLNNAGTGYTLSATSGTLTAATTTSITVTAGVATQLLVTFQPPASVTAGTSFGLTITAADAQGNPVTGFTGSIAVGLLNNPGGSTLSGTTSVSATSGVATFTGLSLNKAGSGYTLQASNASLSSATASAFTVVPGAATQLLVTSQPPATVTAGAGFGLAITAKDGLGNLATGFAGSISVGLASNPGGSSLGGTLNLNATSGVASFVGLTLNKVAAGYTLQATSGTLSSATTSGITVVAGVATQLLVTTQPPSTVTAGASFGLAVTAQDAQGNVATSFAGSITVSIASNPGGSTLGGTTSISATSGVASFAGLTLNNLGNGYTLAASSVGLSTGVTNPFNIVPASQRRFDFGTATSGLTVDTADGFVGVANTTTYNAGLGYGWNASVQAVDRTAATVAADGITTYQAVFEDLNWGTKGSAATFTVAVVPGLVYDLRAYIGDALTGAASNRSGINIALGNASSPNPVSISATATLGGQFTRPVFSQVTALGPTLTVTISSPTTGSDWVINGLDIATSALSGGPGLPAPAGGTTPLAGKFLAITAQPPATIPAGTAFGVTVAAQDALQNVATGFTGNVTVAIANNPTGGTLGGTLSVAATSGIASFIDLSLSKAGTGYTLQLASSGLSSVTTSSINVIPSQVQRFDFGTSTSAVDTASNFVRITNTSSYTVAAGYGWSVAPSGSPVDRGSAAASAATVGGVPITVDQAMFEDLNWGVKGSYATFTIAVTAGVKYDLRAYIGDALASSAANRSGITLAIGNATSPGALTQTAANTLGGQFTMVTFNQLTTTASTLTVTISSPSTASDWVISGLDFAIDAASGGPGLPAAAHQDAAGGAKTSASAASVASLTLGQLAPVVSQAIATWAATGILPAQLALLSSAQFVTQDMSGQRALALTGSTTVYVDPTALGYGWSVDAPAAGRMDLLTVVLHELGHVLGLPDYPSVANDLMSTELPTGTRRLPSVADIDAVLTGQLNLPQVSRAPNSVAIESVLPMTLGEVSSAPPPLGPSSAVGPNVPTSPTGQALRQTDPIRAWYVLTWSMGGTTSLDLLADSDETAADAGYDGFFALLGQRSSRLPT